MKLWKERLRRVVAKRIPSGLQNCCGAGYDVADAKVEVRNKKSSWPIALPDALFGAPTDVQADVKIRKAGVTHAIRSAADDLYYGSIIDASGCSNGYINHRLLFSMNLVFSRPAFLGILSLVLVVVRPLPTDAMTQKLVVVGLNGALRKRFVIQNQADLVPGNVHRASEIQTGIGGKGQDVAIALHCLQSQGVKLLQFVGQGAEGDAVYQLMSDRLGKEVIGDCTVRVKSHMRTCTSIVGGTETTELVEPSGLIEVDEMAALLDKCEHLSSVGGICIMGSMPPGCSDTTYSDIYRRVSSTSSSPLCVMDSVAGVSSVFKVLSGPTIYKVNAQELTSLVGLPSGASLSETIPAFLKKFQPSKHLEALAITDGKRPAHLCWLDSDSATESSWQLFPIDIPKLDASTLYPIGAGDAVAAGTLAAWMALQSSETVSTATTVPQDCQEALLAKARNLEDSGLPSVASTLVAAFAFGLACGSASCLQEENSVLQLDDVSRLFHHLSSSSIPNSK